ncbi:MAG: hypothetical protein JXA90_15240 [Planctomycetes bacterium]|nr:hypothetical protein [Planctomycetota bacterium]
MALPKQTKTPDPPVECSDKDKSDCWYRGFNTGYGKGYADGFEAGRLEGAHDVGYTRGHANGEDKGRSEAGKEKDTGKPS